MKRLNKTVALLMAFFMIFSMLPHSIYATDQEQTNSYLTLVTDTIQTTLDNGAIQRGSSKTFDVVARNKDGEKIDSSVTLNGEKVNFKWNDTDKTSYTLNFTQSGENIVTVIAGEAKVIYKINYQPANKGDVIGTATWCVEGFSIGKGYFVKPIQMEIYEGYNAAYHLEKLLTEHGLKFDYTGKIDSGLYLSGIYDGNYSARMDGKKGGYGISSSPIITTSSAITTSPSAIGLTLNSDGEPDITLLPEVEEIVNNNAYMIDYSYYSRDDKKGNYGLGEFDFTNGSGWMYSVNNIFPNVGFSDSYPADGDVYRVQFTLMYGSDIGGASAMGGGSGSSSGSLAIANKDELTYAIALKGYENIESNDLDVALNLLSTQSSVDEASQNILGDSVGIIDKSAPTLTVFESERQSKAKVAIKFNSDEEGKFYYQLVDKDSTDVNVSLSGNGNVLNKGANTLEITDIDEFSAKDLYIVAKDANGNTSGAYRVPISFIDDLEAPVLSNIKATRTSDKEAQIVFESDEEGAYSYIVAEKEANEPNFDNANSYSLLTGKNIISINSIIDKNEKTVYILAIDAKNNKKVYEISLNEFINADKSIVNRAMEHLDDTLKFMLEAVPAPVQETTGGDWTVMTLARAGYDVPEGYYEGWKSVVDQLMIDKNGVLHKVKYTEYSRLMLPLSALGYDPTNVAGYNILEKYADFSAITKQGPNGPIWALIALDTNNYEIDADALAATSESKRNSRVKMIQYILDKEITDNDGVVGGFALSGKKPDPDMTAMSIQSLAPYYNKDNLLLKAEFGNDTAGYSKMKEDIKGFVDRGLTVLSKIQLSDGDYSSWGSVNSESTAQVLVALLSLGIDPMEDYRFIKDGKTVIDGIMKYAIDGGGFSHTYDAGDAGYNNGGGKLDLMATDQSGYALVAYKRYIDGKTFLYNMTDVPETNRPDTYAPNIFDIKSECIDDENAKITFRINEPGVYYYSIDDKNVDVSGEGIITVLKLNNTININDVSDVKTKKLYIVAKDIHGNVNNPPIEINIGSIDGTKLVLTNFEATRISEKLAEIEFESNKDGKYYYSITNIDEQSPNIDTSIGGNNMSKGNNIIILDNLGDKDEKAIYVIAKDSNSNLMVEAVKVLIPKYNDVPSGPDAYAQIRKAAKEQLTKIYKRCDKSDYTPENWLLVVEAYNAGLTAIDYAQPTDEYAKEIYDELNYASSQITSVPTKTNVYVKVCVSMDANTLGLGYLIKPTIVTVPKYEKASVVITDLLRENGYSWENTGNIEDSFYLSQVKPVNQSNVKIADFILKAAGENSILYEDMNDNELGEFDYHSMSGWMYSISDGSSRPSFPGVGASSWSMIENEVMRWQFTVFGYGSDLNADNRSWGSSSIVPGLGDKTDLTWDVAVLREKFSDEILEKNETYIKALEILTNPQVGQSAINNVRAELKKVDFSSIANESKFSVEGLVHTITIDSVIKNGTATSELVEKDANELLKSAIEGKAKDITVNINSKKDVDKNIVNLPSKFVNGINSETNAKLTIKTSDTTISISKEALTSLMSSKDGIVSIVMAKVDIKDYSKVNKDIIGNRPVYDFKIYVDDKEVTHFNGNVLVYITYYPDKSENTNNLSVYHINEKNEAIKLVDSSYDESSKSLKFMTNHFSEYAVGYEEFMNVFKDVTESSWLYPSVCFVASRGIFNGVADEKFAPYNNMTRSMLVTSLYRIGDNNDDIGEISFSDVNDNIWYSDAVAWGYNNKIITGYNSTLFGTNDNVTREQIAAILYRYATFKKYDTSKSTSLEKYVDSNKVSAYALDAMEWAVANDIINGRTARTLESNATANRAEVATMIMRFIKNVIK